MKEVVVITGGTSGIGKAIAIKYAKDANTVYTLSRRNVKWEKNNMHHIICDITSEDDLKNAVKIITNMENKVDCLFACAGFGISGVTEYTKLEDAKSQFDVNFFGAFSTIKMFLPLLKKAEGKIIFTSSVASEIAIPFQSFYTASKVAMNKLLEAWQVELRPFNIKIVNFLLGDIKTDFTKNRKKNEVDAGEYRDRLIRSVAKMEKDEQNGMTTEKIADVIYSRLERGRLKPVQTIGLNYEIFLILQRVLPRKIILKLVEIIYG